MSQEKLRKTILRLRSELIHKRENVQLIIQEKERFVVHFTQSSEQDAIAVVSENGRNGITFIVNRFDDVTILYNSEEMDKFEKVLTALTIDEIAELVDKRIVHLK